LLRYNGNFFLVPNVINSGDLKYDNQSPGPGTSIFFPTVLYVFIICLPQHSCICFTAVYYFWKQRVPLFCGYIFIVTRLKIVDIRLELKCLKVQNIKCLKVFKKSTIRNVFQCWYELFCVSHNAKFNDAHFMHNQFSRNTNVYARKWR